MSGYRVGRSLGRTIYRQHGDKPSKQDTFIGIVDDPEDAELIVAALDRFWEDVWVQPAIGQKWVPNDPESKLPSLRISDVRQDGRYICRKLDDSGYAVRSALKLNIDYYKD